MFYRTALCSDFCELLTGFQRVFAVNLPDASAVALMPEESLVVDAELIDQLALIVTKGVRGTTSDGVADAVRPIVTAAHGYPLPFMRVVQSRKPTNSALDLSPSNT